MHKTLITGLLLLLPLTVAAEKAPSIMFGDQDPLQVNDPQADAEREKADYCNDLLKQADELKGKPQQRNMVLQQYDLECKSR